MVYAAGASTAGPIDLGMATLKELGAKWLVNTANYISNNPHIIVNGFLHTGIAEALDGQESNDQEVLEDDQELDSDDCMYSSDVYESTYIIFE